MRRNRLLEAVNRDEDQLVAHFGSTRLVRTPRGDLEVRGGTEADHQDAWSWVRRFLTPAQPAGQRGREDRSR